MRWDVLVLEHRHDRPYDEQGPTTLFHPNGTLMACSDRGLCGALGRALLDVWGGVSWLT